MVCDSRAEVRQQMQDQANVHQCPPSSAGPIATETGQAVVFGSRSYKCSVLGYVAKPCLAAAFGSDGVAPCKTASGEAILACCLQRRTSHARARRHMKLNMNSSCQGTPFGFKTGLGFGAVGPSSIVLFLLDAVATVTFSVLLTGGRVLPGRS